MDLVEAGRPAQHADGVPVARTVDVGVSGEQAFDDGEMTAGRGPMQGRCILGAVAQIDIGAVPQQQLDAGEMAVLGGEVQQRPLPRAARDSELARRFGQQLAERVGVALGCGAGDPPIDATRIDFGLERAPARKP